MYQCTKTIENKKNKCMAVYKSSSQNKNKKCHSMLPWQNKAEPNEDSVFNIKIMVNNLTLLDSQLTWGKSFGLALSVIVANIWIAALAHAALCETIGQASNAIKTSNNKFKWVQSDRQKVPTSYLKRSLFCNFPTYRDPKCNTVQCVCNLPTKSWRCGGDFSNTALPVSNGVCVFYTTNYIIYNIHYTVQLVKCLISFAVNPHFFLNANTFWTNNTANRRKQFFGHSANHAWPVNTLA